MLVDEGSEMQFLWGQLYATPAVAEKGYLDVEIKVETLGGHSSVPRKSSSSHPPGDHDMSETMRHEKVSADSRVAVHTGIGYLAKIISAIEERPYEPLLTPENPLNTLLSCAAASSPNMPNGLRRQVQRLDSSLSLSKKHKNKGKKGKADKRALKKITEWWAEGSVRDGTLPPGAGKAMVSTTQAVDIINGGVKINALVGHPYRFRLL